MTYSQQDVEVYAAEYLKRRCEESLLYFTRYIFKYHYNRKFKVNHHHELIETYLQRIEAGVIPNLCINIAPRHTKTELVVKMWMAFTFARNPAAQFIHTSYSDDLALDNSAAVREIIESEAFQRFWPEVKIDGAISAKKLWRTTKGGGVRGGGSGGAITGFGAGVMGYRRGDMFAGCIISDDPLKPDDALSSLLRNRVNNRMSNTLASRRNSPDVPFVIVMQRLHETDPTGFAMAGGLGMPFEQLAIKTLQEDGSALWPEVVSAEYLERLKRDDRYTFASQYQQEPTPDTGGVVSLDWFGRYDVLPNQHEYIVHSWDTASKGAEHNDPSVCTVWAVTQNRYYLLDVYRDRIEYPQLKRMAIAMADKYGPHSVLIEDKASGQALLQDLKKETRLPCVAIMPKDDKITRLSRASATIESGRVFLPNRAPWLADFEREIALFPNGAHDDQCDSLSMFINWMNARATHATPRIRRI